MAIRDYARHTQWIKSIAVGSESFTETIKEKIGIKAKGRKIIKADDDEVFQLREETVSYSAIFNSKKESIELKNTIFQIGSWGTIVV